MRKILLSILSIGVVAVVAFAATQAFFSDTETSIGNTITAGTIDISVDDENPWDAVAIPDEIDDMKPSYVRWTRHVVKNVGGNPLRLWKHIYDLVPINNDWSEPECTDQGGTWANRECLDPQRNQNNIDEYIEYDMYIGGEIIGGDERNDWLGGHNDGGTVIIHEDEGITLYDVESWFVFLGTLEPNQEIIVWQSYHMMDETGNWAQTDSVSFTIEFYAEQVNGNGPISGGSGGQTLWLENKDTAGNWDPILADGTWGVLKWAGDAVTFDFSTTFEAHGLSPNTSYALIYAPDPWPQGPLTGSPSTELGSGASDGDGNLMISANPNLGYDIPHADDDNFPAGGKIWLVLDADHDGTKITGWSPSDYLFEYNLVTYDDTDA